MKNTSVSVYFTLIGDDFNTDYVKEMLHINPTYIRHKNKVICKEKTFNKCTEWGTLIKKECSMDINVQINKALDLYKDKVDLLNKIRIECNAIWNLEIVIYIENGDVPSMFFSQKILKFLASIDAKMDCDIYVLSSRENEETLEERYS